MSKRLPIFYSALLLTVVNLVLRFVGTSFQVYLSGRIGPSGIGLLQLVMSVGSLAMIAGIAGVRTATMYLTAEELGKGRKKHVPSVLSGCFLYSILCSGFVSGILFLTAPVIAQHWIGIGAAVDALRLFAAFLPVCCLCSVMTGYFTAINRIGALTAVEVAEQLISMAVTMGALLLWAGHDPVKACQSVILGSCTGSLTTLGCLIYLHVHEHFPPSCRIPVKNRLVSIAGPLALADILRSGISTTENLMVPKRLARNTGITDPLAAFGVVSGMVFPILMFPSCILYGLSELLIPELARCQASGNQKRITHLSGKCLKITMLYSLLFSGLLFLLAEELCDVFYKNQQAGKYLRLYALLIPMLYCDIITDSMTKGLGQHKICVRYNVLTSALDVGMLYFLLPKFGMDGYFVSFLLSHLINFLLSLRLLLKITGRHISWHIPLLCIASALFGMAGAKGFSGISARILTYIGILFSLVYLLKIWNAEDFRWIFRLITCKSEKKSQPA